jgi:hypothetical protein
MEVGQGPNWAVAPKKKNMKVMIIIKSPSTEVLDNSQEINCKQAMEKENTLVQKK